MKLGVIGAGGLASDVIEIAMATGNEVLALVDDKRKAHPGFSVLGLPLFSSLSEAYGHTQMAGIVVAVGDNYFRELLAQRALREFPNLRLRTLVHPTATISPSATIGAGTIIQPGCRVSSNAVVGELSYLGANTVVAHSCWLADSVSMSPGASLGGSVAIGHRTSIGMNAAVREKVKLGADVIVGAGSYVNKDFPECLVIGGLPAGALREHVIGSSYLR